MNVKKIIERAGEIQQRANDALSPEDRKEQLKYAGMMDHPEDKILLMRLMDESTQISNSSTLVERIEFLHRKYGVLKFLSPAEKILFQLFVTCGSWAPAIAVPAFKKYLRSTTSKVIINEAPKPLHKHLDKRKCDGIGQNVNLIGEVVLGEGEAIKRYEHYLEALTNPKMNYMSIKVSGIYSQLHPLNYEFSKETLIERLSALYRQAIAYPTKDSNGVESPKFINMDMEEYKDMELTFDVFTETLDRPEFKNLYAGIVLQAYLPDSIEMQHRLIAWAQERVAKGGSPIKMRLVKGANLQMESVISSLKHWEMPVFNEKVETDSNYLKMIDYGFTPERMRAVHMGIASHNLFSIAYAQLTATERGVEEFVSFEMLEGMANNLVQSMSGYKFDIVLYTPVVSDENFLNAVSYLVRRLDENTGEDNYIAHSFNLNVSEDDKSWSFLLSQFREAAEIKESIPDKPYRKQNRLGEAYAELPVSAPYRAEPDTDFDQPLNYKWAKSIVEKWRPTVGDAPKVFPIQVGSKFSEEGVSRGYIDNSQDEDIATYNIYQASPDQTISIADIAGEDKSGWREMTTLQRHEILKRVANRFREERGNLIGVMMAVTGKTVMEGDVEVSEAIDFVEYYPRTIATFDSMDSIKIKGKGVVLVIPPWNFPLAIPVGGVVAGLASGNTVVLKPATVSAPIAYEFVKLMHECGVPPEALQIVLPATRESLADLTKHPSISHTILTGGTETAYRILENNPKVPLSAETGGKNAMIVTASADRDIAIASVVQSAFGNAGQKCSACSLLLLHKDLYRDPIFKEKLKDATESLIVGSPWNLSSEVGPMINSLDKNRELVHAIENLEAGESWLVEPKTIDKRGFTLKPGVKWGVKRDSYTFKTELFSPLLAVVSYDTLEEAIEMVNSTGYGLTSGIHSLDEREQLFWKDRVEAGNLYINRGVTGAIVQRQPFGGMKESAFGNGIKAGGPNYVTCFSDISMGCELTPNSSREMSGLSKELMSEIKDAKNSSFIIGAVQSYQDNFKEQFAEPKDVSNIIGEDNHLRYIPALGLALRIRQSDAWSDILMILSAIEITGATVDISIDPLYDNIDRVIKVIHSGGSIVTVESENSLFERVDNFKRLRLCSSSNLDNYFEKAAKRGVYLASGAPLQEGRIELLNYLQEQSITSVYHRYGNLGEREVK